MIGAALLQTRDRWKKKSFIHDVFFTCLLFLIAIAWTIKYSTLQFKMLRMRDSLRSYLWCWTLFYKVCHLCFCVVFQGTLGMPVYSIPFLSVCLFIVCAHCLLLRKEVTKCIFICSILDDIFLSQQVVCRRLKYLRGVAHPRNDSSCTVVWCKTILSWKWLWHTHALWLPSWTLRYAPVLFFFFFFCAFCRGNVWNCFASDWPDFDLLYTYVYIYIYTHEFVYCLLSMEKMLKLLIRC